MTYSRLIGKNIPPSVYNASGIWEPEDQYFGNKNYLWPNIPVRDGLQFYVDPAIKESYSGSSTNFLDLSGNNKNATLVNTPIYDGTAFTFRANTSQYISCGNFGSFYTQGTISFWMNSTDVGNYRNPLHSHFQGGNTGFRFEQATSGNNLGMLFGNDAQTNTGHTLITSGMLSDTWYLITVTWNTSTNTTVGYVNTNQVFNEANTTWPTTIPSLTLGGGFSSSSERWFSGSIGGVMLYNKQLSATEVAQNYAGMSGRYGLPTTTTPGTPTIGTATVTNSTTVSLSFTPTVITGGRSITAYRVSSSPATSMYVPISTSSPLTITGNFAANTAYTFAVTAENENGYGTASASSNSVTPNIVPVVTGGTLTSDATYYYRTFTAGGTLAISGGNITADVIVIAGGGGAGNNGGGGGGAGGVVEIGATSYASGNYSVVVGSGGAGAPSGSAAGTSGNNSSFISTSATGGGGGASRDGGTAGVAGGSGGGGGGGGFGRWAAGAGTSGQGNNGGGGFDSGGNSAGGGGGGKSSAGTQASSKQGGNGGNGYSTTWVSSTGFTGYAGGGAGSGLDYSNFGGKSGTVQAGYGGGGSQNSSALGRVNSGGGGGGMGNGTNSSNYPNGGGAGGSGIVIIRYTRSQVGG